MRIKKLDDNENLLVYIRVLFKKQGKDFYTCEMCGKKSKKKLDIHHTKYENATINDLKIVCHKCNTQPENKFLQ